MAKPFSETLLITQIQNLLNTRKKLREKFLNPASVLSVKDQQNATLTFLTQAESIVSAHLLDPNFSVEVLADKLKISRASLHRKLKNQTDQSATEFIRFIRLKSAVKMLKAGTSSLSEVAYNVGFSSPSYFSISFKKLFGKTPKEYCDEIIDQRNEPK
jgi:AraC-like DNA-binding protein